VLKDLVLPHATDAPAERLELSGLLAVAANVGCELVCPEPDGTSGSHVVVGASMPEAAVNEDCDSRSPKNQIGSACRCTGMQAIPEALPPQQASKNAFRLCIDAADSRHLFGPGPGHVAEVTLRRTSYVLTYVEHRLSLIACGLSGVARYHHVARPPRSRSSTV